MLLQNVIEFIDKFVVLPFTLITFFLLSYIVIYLHKRDPNLIRSRIFLNYYEFKKGFLLFALFAFILVLHVLLVYNPHVFYFLIECSPSVAHEIQHLLGLALAIVLVAFAVMIYKSVK